MTQSARVGSTDAALSKVLAGVEGGYLETVATSLTLTVAQLIDGLLNQTGGTTNAATTPTAAAIVAAIPGCVVGSKFDFTVKNAGSGSVTVTAGAGVTISPIATVTAAKTRRFMGVVTNATAAAEAVTLIALAELA